MAPRTSVEERIAAIWSDVLGGIRVGIHDNFFNLGGHSLTATQVVSRLRAMFQIELPLHVLFEKPTIAQLSHAIEQTQQENPAFPTPKIIRISREQHRVEISSQGDFTLPESLKTHTN